jgi:hypothetical protein
MQQFLEIFSELKGKNFYLTGESVCIVRLDINFALTGALSVCWALFAMLVSSLDGQYPLM